MLFESDNPYLAHEAAKQRNGENRGRRAAVYASFDTVGGGPLEFPERVDFGVLYIHEPAMYYGARIDMDAVRDALELDDDDDPTAIPVTSGYVTGFDQDQAGNYVGAWVAVSVRNGDQLSGAQIGIHHYFTFEGVALKASPF